MSAETRSDAKERIINAAIELFARKGFSATGMRELAHAAGVNLAMVNYYFGSKQRLLEEIFERYFDKHEAMVTRLLATDATPEERIRLALREVFALFRACPAEVRVAFTELPYEVPEFAEFKARRLRRLLAPLIEYVQGVVGQRSIQEFHILDLGPLIFGPAFFHLFMGPVIEKIFDIELDDTFYDTYPDRLANIVIRGVFGHEPPPASEE